MKPKGHPMRKILNRKTFYDACPHCGLSPMDYLIYHLRFPCPVCRNGKLRPDEEADRHSREDVHYGSRS